MNLWRDIVESLGDAIIVLSPSLEPAALNAAAETLLGASKLNTGAISELLARNERLAWMVGTCLASGRNLADPETQLRLARRSVIVRVEVSPLIQDDGRVNGAIILLQDLSHQKSAEQSLEVGEPSLRLSPAGLAHEVKNPLTGIKGAAELLAAMSPPESRARAYCGVILDGVNRVAALVEQVLDFSSPQRLAMRDVNIHRVLHQALKMAGLYPHSPEGIVIEQRFDPSLPDVMGDAGALERVFLNLLRNAIEAIGERGTIRLSTRMETQFRMTAEGRRRYFLRAEVADSGKGVSEAELGQLFTPFFTTKPQGTGLGLVISQRIVALHGGKLWAERAGVAPDATREASPAAPGADAGLVGMTFKVTLPVNTDSPSPRAHGTITGERART
ncbi:MAG: ATP-binding protein [Candidatus Binataceae bacterium]